VTLSQSSFTYSGNASKPTVASLVLDGTPLVAGTDYNAAVVYRDALGNVVDNPKNAGAYTVQITGAGGYSGTATATFTIVPANLTRMTLASPTHTYDGNAKATAVAVYGVGGQQLGSSDYVLSIPAGRVNAGAYTYTATGRGNYTGAVTAVLTINKAELAGLTLQTTSYVFDGAPKTPAAARVTARSGSAIINVPSNCYTMSYSGGTLGDQTATATLNAAGAANFSGGPVSATYTIIDPWCGVTYRTHVQNVGWQGYVSDGAVSGTSGQALRLEGINIALTNHPYAGSIQYRTHIQNIGWEQQWKSDGEMSGTSGQALRLEAIQIQLTGEMAERYDVYYSVHAQNVGWMGWAKNGMPAGTAAHAYRLEAIKIVIVKKGEAAPGSSSNAFFDKAGFAFGAPESEAAVLYRTHVQNIGWQNYMRDGESSGTSGQSLRLEGINIKLGGAAGSGGIQYRTHIQNIGWEQQWKSNDEMSGTSGRALRLEAIQIQLTGEAAQKYDVYYRVHCQNFGWMGWASNGASAGSAGYAYRLEAIEIRLVAKGSAAPGSTDNSFRAR